jgi:hypothetical protein
VFQKGDIFDGEAGGRNVSMRFLAQQLSPDLGRPVLDHTNLPGTYDFHVLPFAPSNHNAPLAIKGAMERLGLHLESAVAPVEEIVIDSVRRPTLTSTVPTQHRAASGPFDPARNPSQDLLAVIKEAKPQHKNILLDVGGNWCGWCLLLDQSMHDEAEVHARLDHFIVLHINYSAQNENKHFLARYPRPRGYPFWYVLSPEGRLLTAKSPESFQISDDAYAYDQSKINAFLDRWRTDLSHVGGK